MWIELREVAWLASIISGLSIASVAVAVAWWCSVSKRCGPFSSARQPILLAYLKNASL